jgi:tRNA A-37 threonylcarbamoyl transferase component Bud32
LRERIGPYRVERVLGTGAFATVWLARDEGLDAQVAVKVLAENWALDEEVRRRFAEEARILWRSASDHIVRVHTVGELEDGRPYFAMDYADRGSLADRMAARAAEGRPFTVDEAVQTSVQIAQGLAVAHALGIVHRDLKPANVLYQSVAEHQSAGADERPVLADFGIARSLARARGTTIATGTPHYMAPEQADGRADERSDLYSAGVILYELLAGKVPFPYDSASQVMTAQRQEPLVPLSSLRGDVPAPIDHLLARALSPDPALRPPSAQGWIAALHAAETGDPGAVGPPLPPVAPVPIIDPNATMGPDDLAALGATGGGPSGPPSGPVAGPPSGPFSGPPGGTPPPPYAPQPAYGPPPGEPPRRRRGAAIAAVAAIALIGLVVAITLVATSGGDPVAADEIFAEPLSSLGIDPFSPDVASAAPILPTTPTLPALPSTLPPPGNVSTLAGGTPGLYGGTNELSVCDAKRLVSFLQDNADKAAAWARVVGVPVSGIAEYVTTLTDVVLRQDTRITNHGFRDGVANPIQSILQAGTAVLVDRFGVPKVRCKCGNPLAPPSAVRGTPTYKGTAWPGFDPTKVVVVVKREIVKIFQLVDLRTGKKIERRPGEEPTPATTTTTTTTAPTTTTTTAPPPPADVTAFGQVGASSEYSGEFATGLAVDGNPATSWFSDGLPGGDREEYRWDSPNPITITRVDIVGNAAHPQFPTNFGFDKVTVYVFDPSGAIAFSQEAALSGTPDPDVTVAPNVVGVAVQLVFEGHEAPDCGGFSELRVFGRT